MRKRLSSLFLLLACAIPAWAQTWSFALLGDLPYSQAERNEMPYMLEAIAEHGADFAVHVGDFKSGFSPCGDELFADRLALFHASPMPLVYVPGDNEWTDCHRRGSDPLERLQRLRALFHSGPESLGRRRIPLERQSRVYPENTRWRRGPVLFIALNVPGSENNIGPGPEPSTEYLARGRANAEWLAEGFARVRREKLPVLVIAIQANPDFARFNEGRAVRGYGEFLTQLRTETQRFSGQVVLLHGDTHHHRIDRPLHHAETGETLANFLRVETYGSPWMGWVEGIVREDTQGVRLTFHPHPWVSGWTQEEDRRFKPVEPPLPPLPRR